MRKLSVLFIALFAFKAQADTYVIRETRSLDREGYFQLIAKHSRANIQLDCASYFFTLTVQEGEKKNLYYLSEETCVKAAQFFRKPSWQKKCLAIEADFFQYGTCHSSTN